MSGEKPAKPLFWVASSRRDLRSFPIEVRQDDGLRLVAGAAGRKAHGRQAAEGIRRCGRIGNAGDAYRAVYTVKFADAVYVLHAFQKKSKRGSQTPKQEINLIKQRLRLAEEHYEDWQKTKERARPEDGSSLGS